MPESAVEVPRVWCGLRERLGGVPRGWIEGSDKYQFDSPEGLEENLGSYNDKARTSSSRFKNLEFHVKN